jgi:photosystem II stability/assembly factor-like uncharacterized protein
MKKLIFVVFVISLLVSCEKSQLDFNSKANDKLIHPDIDLQVSNWIKLDSLTGSSLSDVSFCDVNTGMISGFAGTVFITKNGGESWQTINTNAHMTFNSIYTLNDKTFFAARKGLYKSTDYGTSWHLSQFLTDISIFEIWFKDSTNGFLSSSTGTFRTTDAGETWTKVSDVIAKNLQFTSENIGYFTYGFTPISFTKSTSTDPFKGYGDIYRTTNGGRTWKAMGLDVAEIKSLSFISDKIGFFATNDSSLYKTSDGGESCTLIGKKEFYSYDLFFVNENQGIVCTGNGISITLDGGYTFNKEYIYNGNGLIYDFEFPSSKVGYAIGNHGVILKRIP